MDAQLNLWARAAAAATCGGGAAAAAAGGGCSGGACGGVGGDGPDSADWAKRGVRPMAEPTAQQTGTDRVGPGRRPTRGGRAGQTAPQRLWRPKPQTGSSV